MKTSHKEGLIIDINYYIKKIIDSYGEEWSTPGHKFSQLEEKAIDLILEARMAIRTGVPGRF